MFKDRVEAGIQLASELQELAPKHPIVLALPRGGVPVGFQVAEALNTDLDVLIVRKLGVPWSPEYAFGAIGENGATVVHRDVVGATGMSEGDVDRVISAETAEIARRSSMYRGDHSLPDMSQRTVIVVDDGLATGSTMAAAITVVKQLGAAQIIVAVPVGARDTAKSMGELADGIVCLQSPRDFRAVGLHYRDFEQVPDSEVLRLLKLSNELRSSAMAAENESTGGHHGVGQAASHGGQGGVEQGLDGGAEAGGEATAATGSTSTGVSPIDAEVLIQADRVQLPGHLTVPVDPRGIVLFAHGSGSSRFSSRNQYVARVLQDAGIGTLLFDLLTESEANDRVNVFDIDLLAQRLTAAREWLENQPVAEGLAIGYFGASTGAGAALVAAARRPDLVSSVVSRGGRPDLAGPRLPLVQAPTLLIVGGNDYQVIDLNRSAQQAMRCTNRLEIVPGATHLFEEPGTLQAAALLAQQHFLATLD